MTSFATSSLMREAFQVSTCFLIEAETGSVKMAETLASNLRAAYFKRAEVMLVVEPNANHSSES